MGFCMDYVYERVFVYCTDAVWLNKLPLMTLYCGSSALDNVKMQIPAFVHVKLRSDRQQPCLKKRSPLIHLNGASPSAQRGCQEVKCLVQSNVI